jgi:hypothetical protein
MGQLFKSAHKYLGTVNSDSVFVEIGSDRWEGSTKYFAELAIENNTVLHTVDLDIAISQRLAYLPGIVWHCAFGSVWTKNNFPVLNKKISCLYLDNFDYNWDINEYSEMINNQKIQYKDQFNIDMTNQNCQTEHMIQMLNLYPYLTDDGIIVVDDTYQINQCWVGKCGPVVVFLLANNYEILEANDHGVILTKIKP